MAMTQKNYQDDLPQFVDRYLELYGTMLQNELRDQMMKEFGFQQTTFYRLLRLAREKGLVDDTWQGNVQKYKDAKAQYLQSIGDNKICVPGKKYDTNLIRRFYNFIRNDKSQPEQPAPQLNAVGKAMLEKLEKAEQVLADTPIDPRSEASAKELEELGILIFSRGYEGWLHDPDEPQPKAKGKIATFFGNILNRIFK